MVPEERKLILSKIFQWYGKDFGSRTDVVNLLLRYLPPTEKQQLEGLLANVAAEELHFEYAPYDWSQNCK